MDAELRRQLRRVDWVRVGHRLFTLIRVLRGDKHVDGDTVREKKRGLQMHGTLDDVARNAVGCTRQDDCDCPLHIEERETDDDEQGANA